MRGSSRRALPAALIAATLLWIAAPARADVRALSLYEKSGRAPVILFGEVTGDDRFAIVKVLGVIKGDVPGTPDGSVRIAYRLDSFLRRPWQEPIKFVAGERVLLFARLFSREDGRQTAPDLFTLMWGAPGKYLLPAEGEQVYVDAVRAFVSIQAEADLERQATRLRDATQERNPLLAESALEELIRQGLGDAQTIPLVIGLFGHEREPRRVLAMRLLAQIVADAAVAGRALPDADGLADRIRGLAAIDPSAPFRVEAVAVLSKLGGEANVAFLRRLAREDPDQDVRYAAEKYLLTGK